MAREHDEISRKPDRVIILDADDPMTEIHGRFVWQEEHDRVVDEARRHAFAEGYAAGMSDSSQPVRVLVKRRRSLVGYLRVLLVLALLLLCVLMLPVLLT